jgi:predicted ATPase with chaperone activity
MSGDDYVFSLSPGGRKLAAERALSSRYTGPAPVSLKAWTAAVRAQITRVDVTREKLRRAFSDIVVDDKLLDALGPALISQNAIFLYGVSGTGKTTVAERLMRVFEDAVVVPWAVEVDGQIIMVVDPAVHQRIEFEDLDRDVDPRWLICRRPFLAVGGELVTSMLDLNKDESNGSFSAPLQMKANNGILLIDDFGRQMSSPRDLLNRWIVPLDRRVDFLSFGSGGKFDIPFELQIVFSTNLSPHELADEAFLRRIPNKILFEASTAEQFDEIFRRTAAAAGMAYEAGSEQWLRELCLRHSPDLRPCFPRDICNAMRAIIIYEHRRPAITRNDLERAVEGYFV